MVEILFRSTAHAQVVVLTTSEEREHFAALLEEISALEGWQPGNQIRAYHDQALYLALAVQGIVVGGLQLLLPDAAGGLPYQKLWPDVPSEVTGRAAHVTILALKPEFRGVPGLFWPLCIEVWRYCAAQRFDTIVLEATPEMLERYCSVGWTLEIIGSLREHWGEPCYLTRTGTRDIAGALLLRAVKSPFFRSLAQQAMRSGKQDSCAVKATLP